VTSGQHPLPAGMPTPLGTPPAEVEDAARRRGFGSLISCRALPNPVVTAATWLGVSAAGFVLLYVIAAIGADLDPFSFLRSVLHAVAFGLFFVALYGVVFAIRRLVVGPRSYWVFDNGFIHKQRTTTQALSWAEVQGLAPVIGSKGDTAGKVLEYRLVPATGKPIAVPLAIENGRDPFMDALMAALQRHGKPIS
jgi:hypothetical protein